MSDLPVDPATATATATTTTIFAATMKLTPVPTFNLTTVLSVSKRIISDRYWYLITLNLFFLPLSYSQIIIPIIDRLNHQNFLTSYLIYTLITYILTLCAIGTITYTTHHAFFGSPVKISNALKSLTASFFRLASTAIIAQCLIFIISLVFFLLVGIIIIVVQKLGFVIDYNSLYFVLFTMIERAILITIIGYFVVEWSLAFVVVVVESKWGFTALMRSAYLVKGMRTVTLYFMACGVGMVWMCYTSRHVSCVTILSSLFSFLCLLTITVANTVLYNYCKALHGELVVEGFDQEYMSLPVNDDNIPHVVNGVAA